MRPSEMLPFLKMCFLNHRQVLIKGPPGGGKSDLVDQAAAAADADVLTKHPCTEDPCDVRGLPTLTDIDGIKVATFRPFDDLYQMIVAPKLLVVHLEDFGHAPQAMQKAYMQLLLRRAINGHKLSPHVVFVATTNDVGDLCGVEGFLEAVKSRFHTIVPFETSLDDWVNWAFNHNVPPWLIAYIRSAPDALHEFKPTKQTTNSPSPRNWASVAEWDNLGRHDVEVFGGAVGAGRAAEAVAFRTGALSLPDPDACLLNPDKAPLPEKPSLRYAMSISIAFRVNGANFEQAIRYTSRIGKPFEVLTVKDSLRRDAKLAETTAFAKWASDPINRDISL